MVDPQDIERVEFRTTRVKEGYDQDEVDNFLDRVADSLRSRNEELNKANDEIVVLRRRVAELSRANDSQATTELPVIAPAPTESAAKLLELAQKTADQLIEQAQAQAVEITERADATAYDIKNAATQDADQRRRAAEAMAYAAEEKAKALKELAANTRAHLAGQLEDLHNKLGDHA
jgi:DivIVA domain-containing protein